MQTVDVLNLGSSSAQSIRLVNGIFLAVVLAGLMYFAFYVMPRYDTRMSNLVGRMYRAELYANHPRVFILKRDYDRVKRAASVLDLSNIDCVLLRPGVDPLGDNNPRTVLRGQTIELDRRCIPEGWDPVRECVHVACATEPPHFPWMPAQRVIFASTLPEITKEIERETAINALCPGIMHAPMKVAAYLLAERRRRSHSASR